MEKICIGKYVTTHGIKGEIRIKSDFKFKDKVFKTDQKIYLNDHEYIINSYRVHKEYDMITLKGIDNINDILFLKGSLVYINKSDLKLNEFEYLDTDLISFPVYMNNIYKGNVSEIRYLTNNKKLLVVNGNLVPFELIENIDLKNKKINIMEVEGLL